jgi:Flp pilus assembly protein TadG
MRRSAAMRRMSGVAQRLVRDESGAVLIYVSIALTVFMGFAALVIDGSRLFALDTELQSAADAIALAGAAELDGNADAQDRATLAMNNLVQNADTFGNDPTAIAGATEYTPRFLSALPDDDQPLSDATVAATQPEARFVEVTVNERQVDSMFATAIGGEDTAGADAVAVAGFTSAVCKFTPLFMCNPFESDDDSLAYFTEQFDTTAEKRRIIALKKSGSGAAYTPGNFGFLESETGPGGRALSESLASVDPGTCYRQDGVETKPGSTNAAHFAINVRFDLYEHGASGWKNQDEYRPARNVTKGYIVTTGGGGGGGGGGNACNATLDTGMPLKATGFPHEENIDLDTRVGDGDWDFDTYWDINHGNANGVFDDDDAVPVGSGWANTSAGRPTRYEVYRWELEEGEIPDNSSVDGEVGDTTEAANRCGKAPSDEPDRRIIYAAVLNCNAAGGLTGGSDQTVPALTFIKMFITEPMTKLPGTGTIPDDDTLYVEMVDIVEPGTADEVVHDIVQLYR